MNEKLHQNAYVRNILEEFFPEGEVLRFQALIHGGSDRMFYRVQGNNRSYVLLITSNKDELAFYIELGSFFASAGIAVPSFFHHSVNEGVVLMEDAGDLSLYQKVYTAGGRDEIEELYKEALRQLFRIQCLDASLCPMLSARPFDYATYRWETAYFQENLLVNYLHMDVLSLELEFHDLADRMAREPFYPMHRDFQSQNLFLKGNRFYILDFQGGRTGHLLYDVASLLRDPYVNLSAELQNKLFEWYFLYLKEHDFIVHSYEDFNRQFVLISLQRLMQALGAFGFLGLKKGKKKFLKFIRPALYQLTLALDEIDDFPCLRVVVHQALRAAEEKYEELH